MLQQLLDATQVFGKASMEWILSWTDSNLPIVLLVLVVLGYLVTEMLFKPSWYHAHKSADVLCMNPPGIEDSWAVCKERNGLSDPKTDLGLDFTAVDIPCGPVCLPGNQFLKGWYIPSPKPTSASTSSLCIVICHGGGRDRRQHLRHVLHLRAQGAAVLMFDKQEHGLSDGRGRGIGWFSYEGSDVYAACRYAKQTLQHGKVIAMGTSFGGVGVLTAAGHFDRETMLIDGVIAENPISARYAFIREIVNNFLGFVPGVLRDCIAVFTYVAMMVRRPESIRIPDPIKIIKHVAPRPLLIMHGEADTIVPFEHGMILFDEAVSDYKSFLGVPSCDHCMIQQTDPIGWKREVSKLIAAVTDLPSIDEKATNMVVPPTNATKIKSS